MPSLLYYRCCHSYQFAPRPTWKASSSKYPIDGGIPCGGEGRAAQPVNSPLVPDGSIQPVTTSAPITGSAALAGEMRELR
uniref:Uncharacterized protein n=1 Tax=Knipowitschia caucasica TaxID=637954 RepID=A0AAV2LHP0_KNICA